MKYHTRGEIIKPYTTEKDTQIRQPDLELGSIPAGEIPFERLASLTRPVPRRHDSSGWFADTYGEGKRISSAALLQ